VPASTIIVIESDPESGALISSVLAGASHSVSIVSDPEEFLRRATDAHLVITGTIGGATTATDLCRRIRETPPLASVPVLSISGTDSVEERIAFLEAGADDVMARPIDGRELEARVEALLLRALRSRELLPLAAPDPGIALPIRRLVAVYSPKGGSGATTIATNVAIAAAAKRPDRVLLIDFDVQFGQAATLLNLAPRQSLADMVRDPAALREAEVFRTYAARHDSGLHLLAAPPTPELAGLVEPSHVESILETALRTYDSVVVDAGSVLDDRSLAILERADAVLLPVYAEIAALKSVHALLDYLGELGSIPARVTLVLNQLFAREILRLKDIESALGTTIGLELPYDPFVYLKAANEGVPVVLGAPRSKAAEGLERLAVLAFGEDYQVDRAPVERRSGRLGSLLRRS
jgi:pilus assembly protein CpaE